MELAKNKVYRAELVDYTADGSSVARIGGMTVFVPGGAVGDHCDIRIVKVNRRMAYGRIEKIIVASKHRIVPACPYAGRCGGCCWQHITYAEELRAKKKKVEDALHRIGGLPISVEQIIGADSIERYRNKAQYPVGMRDNEVITGFYRVRSHEIVPIEQCRIQSQKADQIAGLVCRWMRENHVTAYDERTGKGVVRYIYVRVGATSGQAQLCLIIASRPAARQQLIDLLTQNVPSLVSVVFSRNVKRSNTILGETSKTIWGTDTLEDTLCGNRFRLSPYAFYQVNHEQAEKLYQQVLRFADLQGTERVLELYCGAGTITLALARHAREVIGVESVQQAVDNAAENAALNGITNVSFRCADAGQAAVMLANNGETPDVLVVDPPRKGLDETAIHAAGMLQPARMIYVSCDPATLARDCALLVKEGYTVKRCVALDMFPRTAHVECVVLMTKVQK